MNCLMILPEDVRGDGTAALHGAPVQHVRAVLKKNAGDTVFAGLLNGPVGEVRIIAMDESTLRLALPQGPVPPPPDIDVILAMPRPKVMKRLWAPLASLGVGTIAIIGAEKVEPYYFESHALDERIYRPRLIEGLAQVRDTHMPAVEIHRSFAWFAANRLDAFAGASARLLAQPGPAHSVRDALSRMDNKRHVLAIGPEGGWTPAEVALFEQYQFVPAGMGERTLRTDVAVIALLSLIRACAP